MKTLILPVLTPFFILLSLLTFAQPYGTAGVQTEVRKSKTDSPYAYYEYLPKDYDGKKKVPLVLFFHGVDEGGNGENELKEAAYHGPSSEIKGGTHYPAIVISPQSPSNWFNSDGVKRMYDYIRKHYSIDTNRIYVTGLSAGGQAVWNFSMDYPEIPAAIIPICGAGLKNNNAPNIRDMPIWAFHNWDDNVVHRDNTRNRLNEIMDNGSNVIAAYNTGDNKTVANDTYTINVVDDKWTSEKGVIPPKENIAYTLYTTGGHNAWGKTYKNQAVWDWLFSQKKSIKITLNTKYTIYLPSNNYVIDPEVYFPYGGGDKYKWTKTNGGKITTDVSGKKATFKNYEKGLYQFRFTAYNTSGDSLSKIVNLDIRNTNKIPTANAGDDIIIGIGDDLMLNGSKTKDEDGTITKYEWRYIYGDKGTYDNVKINFSNDRIQQNSDNWNNTNNENENGTKFNKLKNYRGSQSSIQLQIDTRFDGVNDLGAIEGDNSGVFPDNVLRTSYYVEGTKATLSLKNLDNNSTYKVSVLGSRDGSGDRKTLFKIGTKQVVNDALNNTDKVSFVDDLKPSSGTIPIEISRNSGASYGYLNGMVVERNYLPIVNSTSKNATVKGLPKGVYYFELEVFDNENASHKDTVRCEVATNVPTDYLELNQKLDINVYSTFTQGVFKVDNPEKREYFLMSVLGEKLIQGNISSETLDLRSYSYGVYFLIADNGSQFKLVHN